MRALPDAYIDGVPFLPVGPHDGRFMRSAGLFAFARQEADGWTVLHFELSPAINRDAVPSHRRWAWALGRGMTHLLVHFAGAPAAASDAAGRVRWDEEAWFVTPGPELGEDDGAEPLADAAQRGRRMEAGRSGMSPARREGGALRPG